MNSPCKMEKPNQKCEEFGEINDFEIFDTSKAAIEKELTNLKKIVNNINQMRVEAAYMESDLVTTISAATWTDITELIGLSSMKILDNLDFDSGK